jgi:hypothetical protein
MTAGVRYSGIILGMTLEEYRMKFLMESWWSTASIYASGIIRLAGQSASLFNSIALVVDGGD